MKKIKLLKLLIIIINLIVIIRIFDIMIIKHDIYKEKHEDIKEKIIYASSAPRGRILDKNGVILVDNKGIKSLSFKLTNNESIYSICLSLAHILSFNDINISNDNIKGYYYLLHKKEINNLLDKKIVDKYNSKLINEEEYLNYIYSFISDKDIENINKLEVYIYNLATNGYGYDDKIIKNNLTEEEVIKINELNYKSLNIIINWQRTYNYDTVLNDLFGSIGHIEKEDEEYYKELGYSLDDIVGVSFLEKYYENILKGEKAIYKLKENGDKELIKKEIKGNDLVLGIDIYKQLEIESILKEEIKTAKKYPSSKYYNGSYVIVSNPNTGLIEGIAGFNIKDEIVSDVIGMLTNSYALGSVVKGASQTVAFNNNVIDINKKIKDGCVKLKNMPPKCSWTNLGNISDIDALAKSSNYYQFINAIKVSGFEYNYNMNFNPSDEVFKMYRDTFKSYGLGDLSGIDLYEEDYGLIGDKTSGDLLLNYVIGQYDTYTPLMLTSYINTIANNGERLSLRLVNYAIDNNNQILNINERKVLNKVDIKSDDLKRIQLGFKSVITRGTGGSYLDKSLNAAGKTGTSETFIDSIKTTTKSFISYFPYDSPIYSLVIISPNLKYKNEINNYSYPINTRLANKISHILVD